MMKKKNGFISISVVYSFFVVFMLLLIIIINSYTNDRASFDIYKDYVKEKMAGKYSFTEGDSKKFNEEIQKMYDDPINNYRQTDWITRPWYIDKVDDNYYFRGSTPPNFVCLSSDSKDNCQENDSKLYRIIGVFKITDAMTTESDCDGCVNKYLVKLVKFSPYTTTNHSGIYGALMQYADSTSLFDDKTRNMVAPVKQTSFANSDTSKTFSEFSPLELSNRQTSVSFASLLTVSDIGYTTGVFSRCNPNNLPLDKLSGTYNFENTYCNSYGWNISEQWLYNSDNYEDYTSGFKINNSGSIEFDSSDTVLSIRPVIYLKPDAIILKGDGSQNNPYMLNISTGEDTSE